MDKLNIVEKLREKTGITYEEAKCVLEINNWDILDSILYLEEQGKVKRPSVSIFYTNEYNENYEDEDQQFNFQEVKKDNNYKSNKRELYFSFFFSARRNAFKIWMIGIFTAARPYTIKSCVKFNVCTLKIL